MTASVVNASATPIACNGLGVPTTPGIPADTAAGMLVLLSIMARTTGVDINTASTYTRLSGDDDDQGTACVGEIQGKIAGSSESAPSVTSTIVDTQPTCAFLLAITGWSGDLNDITVSAPNAATNANTVAPAVTATADDTAVVRIYMMADDNTIVTPPAGHTSKFFQLSTQGSDALMAAYVMDTAINNGESSGTATAVWSGSDPSLAYTVLIKPSAGAINLVISDTAQGQTSDTPTITVDSVSLSISDTAQGQTADNPALTQVHSLAVSDSAQGQITDSPSLNQGHALTIQDAFQGQTVDTPSLSQTHILSIQDSRQAQSADNVILTLGDITTPAKRTIMVDLELRTVDVSPENRTVEVEEEVRVIDVTDV